MTFALANKYVVGDLIGSGGMGLVYAAEQLCLGRTVAVKLMRAEYAANTYMLRKFHTEAIVGSRLHHPNLVRVIDDGTAADVPFLVMELVDGQLLSSLLVAEGSFTPRRAATLAGELLAGLAAAHHAGIVHADIKTDNVIVADGGHVTLIDFGLARFVDDPSPRSPLLSGTPEYLAPELILGGVATPASDVYAAGVLLYELLTGEPPFVSATLGDVLGAHLDDEVIPPSLRNPDGHIPLALERVVMRALDKEPAARFADAGEFAGALAAATPARDDDAAHVRSRPVFASESTTLTIPASVKRGAPPPARDSKQLLREALVRGDVARIVSGYLDLARHLVDERCLAAAALQLEEGIDIVTAGAGPAAADAPEPVWRLLLTLAAVYDGLGDRARARHAALAGQSHAIRCSSPVGRERAEALITRLGHHAA